MIDLPIDPLADRLAGSREGILKGKAPVGWFLSRSFPTFLGNWNQHQSVGPLWHAKRVVVFVERAQGGRKQRARWER